jgi:hypothetical protein
MPVDPRRAILAAEPRHVRERERRTDHLRRQAPWRRVGDGKDGTGFTREEPSVEQHEEIQNRTSSPALKGVKVDAQNNVPFSTLVFTP